MVSVLNLKPALAARIDQRVCLHGVSWQDFEALLAMRGDDGAVRVSYLEGELELMAPSIDHENLKTRLARLLEAYAVERGIELEGFGSWTLKAEARARRAEADECYLVGWRQPMPPVPDIVIQVIWTSGGLDKLAIYRGLGVPEVWFWQEGRLSFYLLDERGYTVGPRSTQLPDLDPRALHSLHGPAQHPDRGRACLSASLARSRSGQRLKSDGGDPGGVKAAMPDGWSQPYGGTPKSGFRPARLTRVGARQRLKALTCRVVPFRHPLPGTRADRVAPADRGPLCKRAASVQVQADDRMHGS